jgi:predicted membrane protein
MFGGTKLIVPSDWDVQSGVVTIFGGIEDKRQPAQINPVKVLYLDGTCIFGGVEIKSF